VPRRPALCAGLVVALLAIGVLVGVPTAAAGDGTGDEPPAPTTLPQLPEDAGRIIKHPNYGHEPTHPGDRGGWQQELIAGLMFVGLVVIGGLIWRESRRRRPHPAAVGRPGVPGGPAPPA
jgi:hypothetical protein